MKLLPPPKRLRKGTGYCTAPRRLSRITAPVDREEPDAYRITIAKGGISLQSQTEAGLFYAAQTLGQIRKQHGAKLPCVDITDWPDYPVRGFYHDVTRGKVPTLKTLLALAETCAAYKINQLQLYIEHTYAYKNHPEVWRDADPLTADEIRALDARCAELHIDLVPSFSTFGHFYTWIHHKFPELNELERDVSGEPFCWWDRMQHYTLDCRNPRSIELIREIIQEVRPLFRSRYFNLCADETFDLGKGRNKALAEQVGKGQLYVDFLKQIMTAVRDADAVPMFWGDIIGHYPELLAEIPTEAVALDWDYSPSLKDTKAALMQKSGRKFFICPGVRGWNVGLPDYPVAHRNITRFAAFGLKHGAAGLLNTDWGDYGHINLLGPTFPGIVLGASAAWNSGSRMLAPKSFDAAASRLIFGDPSGKLLSLLKQAVALRKAEWTMLCWTQQPRSKDFPEDWFDAGTGLPNGLFKHSARAHALALKKMLILEPRIHKVLARCRPESRLILEEIRTGLMGMQVMEEIYLIFHHQAGKSGRLEVVPRLVAQRILRFERRLASVWKRRNKPSEYFRIRDVLHGLADRISGL